MTIAECSLKIFIKSGKRRMKGSGLNSRIWRLRKVRKLKVRLVKGVMKKGCR